MKYDYDDLYEDWAESFDEPPVSTKENRMSKQIGDVITTGNYDVRQLPVGTVLEVIGKGELEVIDLPKPAHKPEDFAEGDQVMTKHGPATIVRLSVRLKGLEGFDPATQVLYVADADCVVRRQDAATVEFL